MNKKSFSLSYLFSKKDKNRDPERKLSQFLEIGFHGDVYLIEFVISLLKKSQQFIETGTNVGTTLHFVINKFPMLRAFSCEPHKESYEFALNKIRGFTNVILKNELSPDFLYNLAKDSPDVLKKDTLFWLDSHGYGFRWPLKEEVHFITHNFKSAYLLIDDFLVPDNPQFIYDTYEQQICSFDYIKDSLNPKLNYNLFYPCYQEKTSQHHPLKGWIMIEWGHTTTLQIPKLLQDKITHLKKNNA